MIHFNCDYMAGACDEVMRNLVVTNNEQTPGYGLDSHSVNAANLIRQAIGSDDAKVMFLVGGTQTNATVIDGLLSRHEGVVAADSAHIAVHEAGAIEAAGHKVITIPHHEGKISADEVEKLISEFYADETYPHMVAPGMLYISFPTEYGTVYSLNELKMLREVCHRHHIPLYIDGARLAYGLAVAGSDVGLKDIARIADVFYIGGTKVGALFGEAVVVTNPALLKNFFPLVKQHGALLAKGRLLGVQFETLFTDNLYLRIGQKAVRLAIRIKEAFLKHGFNTVIDSPTNQQFFYLPNLVIDSLRRQIDFDYWGPRGEEYSTVRFVTSWETTDSDVDTLVEVLDEICLQK